MSTNGDLRQDAREERRMKHLEDFLCSLGYAVIAEMMFEGWSTDDFIGAMERDYARR